MESGNHCSVHVSLSKEAEVREEPGKLSRWSQKLCRSRLVRFCLLSENPLPENPNVLQQIRWYFLCPPHSHFGWILTRIVGLAIAWTCLWGLVGNDEAYFGGNIFSIFLLYVTSRIAGFFVSLFNLPPLLGMLVAGICLSNIGENPLADDINSEWKVALRDFSFITILIRAGLSLNPRGLMLMKNVVVRLAFLPGVGGEGPTIALLSYLFMDLPIDWAFMLGFIMAAVSPAVVVPSLLRLQNKGYGVEQGIPTLIIAAASIDDIIAISAFSIVMSLSFGHKEGSFADALLHAPKELLSGFFAASVAGIVMWYIPPPDKHEVDKKGHLLNVTQNHTTARFLILFGTGIMFMFGFNRMKLAGAGALGCLCVSFITGLGWDLDTKRPVGEAFGHAWNSLMPLLFGLIGSEVKMEYVNKDLIGVALIVIGGGLVVRIIISFATVFGVGLNMKEQLFVAIAWIPKATVQAAISGIPLDMARKAGNAHQEELGKQIITVSVLAILLTAPLGAIGIRMTGKRLLQQPKRITRRSVRRRSSVQKSDGLPRPLVALQMVSVENDDDTVSPVDNNTKFDLSTSIIEMAEEQEESTLLESSNRNGGTESSQNCNSVTITTTGHIDV